MLTLFMRFLLLCSFVDAKSYIKRCQVVRAFNPHRNESSSETPLQVGNGNFAFGADVTGLQTFHPFATMSSWGWHNFSLPETPGQAKVSDYKGKDLWTHGRLVNYEIENPDQPELSAWLRANPQRINLGNIGLHFADGDVTEKDLDEKSQDLDLWSGKILSTFVYKGTPVKVKTSADPESDTLAISIESDLLRNGLLGIFFDFPYSDVNKFDAPYVGVWNETGKHTTTLEARGNRASIHHVLDDNDYYVNAEWEEEAKISGPLPGTHRYVLKPGGSRKLQLTTNFSLTPKSSFPTADDINKQSAHWWREYWKSGSFLDLTPTEAPEANELQRRIILSLYLEAVNEAGYLEPQESGLVNNGWFGKFHLEMCLWHSAHFARWNHWDLLRRSAPSMYERLLPSSYARAARQGYEGARWGKMTSPEGLSAPGEINALLIWQQPHPTYFAELEWRSFPSGETLRRWDDVVAATADFMASFAWFNASTGVYDLGPPLYPVSENTAPAATRNPTFELAYWRFGLDVAARWRARQGREVPPRWAAVRDALAPLPVEADGTYPIHEGVAGMWTDPATVDDHPAMAGIYGLLPPTTLRATGEPPLLNMTVVRTTAARIRDVWNLPDSYGWDFAMLAMNAARLGDADLAVAYLLDPAFRFDDAGYPVGGARVPTPYFPNSAGLLLAVAMMAGGWDGSEGAHFPEGWTVRAEGFVPTF